MLALLDHPSTHHDIVNAADDNSYTAMHQAVREVTESAEVVSVLAKHPKYNPRVADDIGRTPLHWAAASGHAHICAILMPRALKHGVCDLQDHSGNTALHYAVQLEKTECVAVLLSGKADPNIGG